MNLWNWIVARWNGLAPTVRMTIGKILGLWFVAMIVLLIATPGWFSSWSRNFGLFIVLPVVLVTVAIAINPSGNPRGIRWIGGMVVAAIVLIFLSAVEHRYFGQYFEGGHEGAPRVASAPATAIVTPLTSSSCTPFQNEGCVYELIGGQTATISVPPATHLRIGCVGVVTFVATWNDNAGSRSQWGDCSDINLRFLKNSYGPTTNIRVEVRGGSSGGRVVAKLDPL